MTTGQGGTRPTLAIWAALVTILTVVRVAPAKRSPRRRRPRRPPQRLRSRTRRYRRRDDSRQRRPARARPLSRRDDRRLRQLPHAAPAGRLARPAARISPAPSSSRSRCSRRMRATSRPTWRPASARGRTIKSSTRSATAQNRDGTFCGPPMSFGWYKHMSDTDVRAIVEVRASGPAVRNEVPPSTYQIPLNGYGPMVTSVPDVPKTDIVKYGEYLAGPLGHCMDCHTTYVMGVIDMKQLGHGGNVYTSRSSTTGPRYRPTSRRIRTRASASGRTTRSRRAITDGVSRDGRKLLPFMPYGLYSTCSRAISTRSSRTCARYRRSARRPRFPSSRLHD